MQEKQHKKRGFLAMSPAYHREVARKGGNAAHARGGLRTNSRAKKPARPVAAAVRSPLCVGGKGTHE
jgi:hypothetical protein